MHLQDKWEQDFGNKNIASEMFLLIQEYARNIIKARIRGRLRYTNTKLDEQSYEAASLLMEYYLRDPAYRVKSFFGCLDRMLDGVMYGSQREDKVRSLNAISERGSELQDNLVRMKVGVPQVIREPFYREKIEKLEGVVDLISERIRSSQSSFHSLVFALALRNHTRVKKIAIVDRMFEPLSNEHRENYEKSQLIIRNYLIRE
jgi:hypothetical protein